MADSEEKKAGTSPGSDGDNLLKDLNIDDVEGLEDAQIAGGQPLPKKVELDIDDMMLEEDEEEAAPEESKAAAPLPEPELPPSPETAPSEAEEKPPRRKISTTKLILLILAFVLPLVIIVAPVIYIFFDKPVETTEPQVPPPVPKMLELKPFIINFPSVTAEGGPDETEKPESSDSPAASPESIIQIIVMVDFPDSTVAEEFKKRESAIRDGLFRYFQGVGLKDIEDVSKQPELSPGLTSLVNGYLNQGRVRSVQVVSVGTV
jgi:flagellar basal body-associated protein FliL